MKDLYLTAIHLYEAEQAAGRPADICQCCGAAVPEGVKGCFELYAGLGARAYADPAYGRAAFYGVDAHALQHPEIHGKKNNAAHLLRLAWIFEYGAEAQAGTVPRWWQQHLARGAIPVLAPPAARGAITVVDVAAARSADEYAARMRAWARAVYGAWHAHHAWARRELARILG